MQKNINICIANMVERTSQIARAVPVYIGSDMFLCSYEQRHTRTTLRCQISLYLSVFTCTENVYIHSRHRKSVARQVWLATSLRRSDRVPHSLLINGRAQMLSTCASAKAQCRYTKSSIALRTLEHSVAGYANCLLHTVVSVFRCYLRAWHLSNRKCSNDWVRYRYSYLLN